jgi:DNA polymerase (family 10)
MTATLTTARGHNRELATVFRKMSDCYKYLGPEHRFRAIAYETAAKTLSNMKEPVDAYGHDMKKLDELKGVGESIAEKITEYLDTGRIQTFEKLRHKVPYKLMELMDTEGIGPATIRILHDKLKVNTREDVIEAIEKGKLQNIKGFGEKKINNLRKVLKLDKDEKKRLPLKPAIQMGEALLREIKKIPGVQKAALAGSLRRKKETVGDIDIIATTERQNLKANHNDDVNFLTPPPAEQAASSRCSVLLFCLDFFVTFLYQDKKKKNFWGKSSQ